MFYIGFDIANKSANDSPLTPQEVKKLLAWAWVQDGSNFIPINLKPIPFQRRKICFLVLLLIISKLGCNLNIYKFYIFISTIL